MERGPAVDFMNAVLESIDARDETAVLALNSAFATELSELDQRQLRMLVSQAFYARRIGHLDAFLLVLDHTSSGDESPNYLWFRKRFERFVYVDRVVVSHVARRNGYARQLYEDLFRKVADAGHDKIVCEVNVDPPNPQSDAFHERLGFAEIGRAAIHNGAKSVRYLMRSV